MFVPVDGDELLQTCNDSCEHDRLIQRTSKGLSRHSHMHCIVVVDIVMVTCVVCASLLLLLVHAHEIVVFRRPWQGEAKYMDSSRYPVQNFH